MAIISSLTVWTKNEAFREMINISIHCQLSTCTDNKAAFNGSRLNKGLIVFMMNLLKAEGFNLLCNVFKSMKILTVVGKVTKISEEVDQAKSISSKGLIVC